MPTYAKPHARSGTGLLHRFANPGRFLRLAARVQPWLTGAGLILTAWGLLWGLFFSPADWQQGDAVRIMYVHVPAAWLASAGYAALAVCSALSLVWRHPLADLAAAEIGPVGAAVTAICLASGSLWGKPMWGAWWVWDARLTSVLVLFFLYLGHVALMRAFDEPQRGARAAAILALVGAVDLPIIKFSVQWWNTLHQPDSHHPDRGADHVAVDALAAAGRDARLQLRLRRDRDRPAACVGDGAEAAHAAARPQRRVAGPGGQAVTHLPFIAAAYGLTLALAAWLGVGAALRLSRARRRLAAVEADGGRRSTRAREGRRP